MSNESQLAPRETMVADLLIQGYGAGEIAQRMKVTATTVSTHIARIRSKLGARSTIHAAVKWALFRSIAEREYASWSSR